MSQPEIQDPFTEPKEGLPFDIRTTLLSLWQRKFWIVAGVVLSILAGIAVGFQFGSRQFRAEMLNKLSACSVLHKHRKAPCLEGGNPREHQQNMKHRTRTKNLKY